MKLSTTELAEMRSNVTALLEELNLEAYLFEVEPKENQWEIRVECAIDEGWETICLSAAKDYLLHGIDDAVAREVLLDNWREALTCCRTKPSK
ncbi:MAG: hypothetical protein PVG20_09480 [Thioalkalispiraceae bacterium]|jgi:hypothetical protein